MIRDELAEGVREVSRAPMVTLAWSMATIMLFVLLGITHPHVDRFFASFDREQVEAIYAAQGLFFPPPHSQVIELAGHPCLVRARTESSIELRCRFIQPTGTSGLISPSPRTDIMSAMGQMFPARRTQSGEVAWVQPIGAMPITPWLQVSDALRLASAAMVLAGLWLVRRRRRRSNGTDPEAPPDGRHGLSRRLAWLCATLMLLVMMGIGLQGTTLGMRWIVAMVGTSLVAPFVEEVLFRELPMRFQPTGLARLVALVVGSFVFALLHGQPGQMAEIVATGLVLGLVWWRTRSVWPSVALHAAWNFVA